MLFKCEVCNYIHEGEEAPDFCPKCGAPKEKFVQLTEDESKKVYDSVRTNDIHMEIISLATAIIDLGLEGIDLDLDPACTQLFKKAIDEAWIIKQRSKAELEGHVKKGKW